MFMLRRLRRSRVVLTVSITSAFLLNLPVKNVSADSSPKRPNILFIVMDDVGIDKMRIFGYGGAIPPQTPNIDAIAHAGVRFRNVWAMPECSPSRAVFFVGRYPLRTNILAAIGSADLANSQVSPFEVTTPKLLKEHSYTSAMFGKFHIAGPDNNPAGNGTPSTLGWDFFYGYIGGLPASVDTTAGGVAPIGTYSCGFVPGTDGGACYVADGSCSNLPPGGTPGRTCLESGGIFVQNQSCQSPAPGNLNFTTLNAYYVSPLVIDKNGSVEEVSPADPRSRVYRTTLEVNAARDWINQQKAQGAWMASVTFSSAHTPYQQPPLALLPPGSAEGSTFDCTNTVDQRTLSNQMIESMDTEIGRLLVEVGLATRTADGQLDYHPEATNTMVVVVGDNGSFGGDVKPPFNPIRAKGTVYQTGVWVPLIVAGPLVTGQNREVTHMVNVADLFELFGEVGGLDVHQKVPPSHILDSMSMLPYLTNPTQPSIRTSNFTQGGYNIAANGARRPPCVTASVCQQIPPDKSTCEDNGGVWWGPGNDLADEGVPPEGFSSCCEVNQFLQSQGQSLYQILPDAGVSTRNDRFKLVQNTTLELNKDTSQCENTTTFEFYEINEQPVAPELDGLLDNLLTSPNLPPQGLNPEQLANFNALYAELQTVLTSEVPCPGDGNLNKKVNKGDLNRWKQLSTQWGQSSVYDFNFDGLTDDQDRTIIEDHLGTKCSQ